MHEPHRKFSRLFCTNALDVFECDLHLPLICEDKSEELRMGIEKETFCPIDGSRSFLASQLFAQMSF